MNLLDWLQEKWPPDAKGPAIAEATVASILKQSLEGIKYIHAQNSVHRDIKPQNIMVY